VRREDVRECDKLPGDGVQRCLNGAGLLFRHHSARVITSTLA
jgi:hypothetical protein